MKVKVIKCPSCNASLDIDPGQDKIYCKYCGNAIYIDRNTKIRTINIRKQINENRKYTYEYIDHAKVREEERKIHEAKSESKFYIGILVLVFLCIAICIPFGLMSDKETAQERAIAKENGWICPGTRSEDYKGKNYKSVQAELEAAGFKNIELIDLKDSGIVFTKNNKVESVSIGGDTHFYAEDYFDPESMVTISYH